MRGVLVTGASGFLGSALVHEFCSTYTNATIIACDRRPPSDELKAACPQITWIIGDLLQDEVLDACFEAIADCDDTYVYHFAAYYDFERKWSQVYQQNNIDLVKRICERCEAAQISRLIFASSIAAYALSDLEQSIDENSSVNAELPYGKSKRMGEDILKAYPRLAYCILRIGAVFTEYAELPPLFALLKLWTSAWPMNSFLLAKGQTGMPYIHRKDFIALSLACMERSNELNHQELFLACDEKSIVHGQLFEVLPGKRRAIHCPVWIAKIGLSVQIMIGRCIRKMPFERLWMFDFADRTFAIDNAYTRSQLRWSCAPERDIRIILPHIIAHVQADRRAWKRRNLLRNERAYQWSE